MEALAASSQLRCVGQRRGLPTWGPLPLHQLNNWSRTEETYCQSCALILEESGEAPEAACLLRDAEVAT